MSNHTTATEEMGISQNHPMISVSTVERIEITGAFNLDPVRVYIEDYEPGKGRITISCFDAAWVGYWNAMGGRTVREFLRQVDADYVAGNMMCASTLKSGQHNRRYLTRVIQAVLDALRVAEAK